MFTGILILATLAIFFLGAVWGVIQALRGDTGAAVRALVLVLLIGVAAFPASCVTITLDSASADVQQGGK